MSVSQTQSSKLFGAAVAAVLSLAAFTPAGAAPPPGERWSDMAFRGSSRSQPSRVGPTYQTPGTVFTAPPAVAYRQTAPAAVASVPAASPATVAIRGPDGVVRTFPVEGPTVQQGGPAFVSVRGADGVVRTYPAATTGQVAPSPGQPTAAPVVTHPCR
ncbi:MAG: hypothetical protein K2X87_19955 [Gemmataceae bacterium]|nr:hypothetical protein [Gemmataceae bacterium]